jgi:hypothetical protein
LAFPVLEANSCSTPSTRFWPGDFGETATLSNLARLVGTSHVLSPARALFSISARLLVIIWNIVEPPQFDVRPPRRDSGCREAFPAIRRLNERRGSVFSLEQVYAVRSTESITTTFR